MLCLIRKFLLLTQFLVSSLHVWWCNFYRVFGYKNISKAVSSFTKYFCELWMHQEGENLIANQLTLSLGAQKETIAVINKAAESADHWRTPEFSRKWIGWRETLNNNRDTGNIEHIHRICKKDYKMGVCYAKQVMTHWIYREASLNPLFSNSILFLNNNIW